MKNEEIFEAMADIDEKYITEAKTDTVKTKKKPFVKWIVMAACFFVVLGVVIGIGQTGLLGKTPLVEIAKTSEENTNNAVPPTNEERKTNDDKNESETEITTFDSSNIGTANKPSIQSTTTNKQDNQSNTDGNKGGNTAERLQNDRIGADGGYYSVFKPGIDKFEPIDHMTLENRFCSFVYNGHSYYPIPNGEITKDDYEPNKLTSVKAESWELRSANAEDDTSGIIYYAKIDIYKLKGVNTSEAVACVISFNGETKEYRYNAV